MQYPELRSDVVRPRNPFRLLVLREQLVGIGLDTARKRLNDNRDESQPGVELAPEVVGKRTPVLEPQRLTLVRSA